MNSDVRRLFGSEKDVGWTGQPNVERDFIGNPVPESTFLGGQVHGDDGRLLVFLPGLWLWAQLATASASLFWLTGQWLPRAALAPRLAIAALPWVMWGWAALLSRRSRLGWALTFLLILAAGAAAWLRPDLLQSLAEDARALLSL